MTVIIYVTGENERKIIGILKHKGVHMEVMKELQRKIESVRSELDEAVLQEDEFDQCYQKSTELDELIEQYLERKEKLRNLF